MTERYTTQPSTQWPGYVDIIEHRPVEEGGPWCCGSCPAGREQERIAEMLESGERHWQHVYDRRFDPRHVIAGQHAYWIGSSSDDPKGFGGQRWRITFLDGRSIVCDSLWHAGYIQPEWRDRLPDNAVLQALS